MTTIIQIADWDVVRMGALFALGMIGVSALVVTICAGLLAAIYWLKAWRVGRDK